MHFYAFGQNAFLCLRAGPSGKTLCHRAEPTKATFYTFGWGLWAKLIAFGRGQLRLRFTPSGGVFGQNLLPSGGANYGYVLHLRVGPSGITLTLPTGAMLFDPTTSGELVGANCPLNIWSSVVMATRQVKSNLLYAMWLRHLLEAHKGQEYEPDDYNRFDPLEAIPPRVREVEHKLFNSSFLLVRIR
ncbi:hypothetical protein QVD17_38120 [Tagetes erecta]|uniref:Uncharacterized protein n=1 Tax=Tagetes erecta TaxID=13708 RepID=A0AAD8ND98_TARER|nr:hypothetical protein QVD17_38120 [Tagetes erecta]